MCHTSSHPSVGLVSRGQPGLLFNRSRWPICTRGSSMEGHCPVPRQGVGRFHGSQQSGKFLLWYMTNVKCDLHTIRQYWFLICVYDQSKPGKDLECHAIGAIVPWNNCRIIQHLDVQKLVTQKKRTHCLSIVSSVSMSEHTCLCVSAAPRHSTQKTGRDWLPSGEKRPPQAAGQPCKALGLSARSEWLNTYFHPGYNITSYL